MSLDFFEEEIIKFFKNLNNQNVKYILIGGFAVNIHGFNRSTGDLDLWLLDSKENRNHFVNALADYGIEGAEFFHTLPFIAGYTEIILNNGFAIDVMADMQFFKQENFEECYKLAKYHEIFDNLKVRVIHINQLISEKESSLRPKDKLDADELKKIIGR